MLFEHLDQGHYLPRVMRRTLRRRRNVLVLFTLAAVSTFLFLEFSNELSAYWNCYAGHSSLAPKVHLVPAAITWNDLKWTERLNIPNLEVIPYIADNPRAKHHPPTNRGNEAMLYLTYLYEFYDELPDITIFTHGSDWSWHIDGALQYSTAYAIEHLDLNEVRRRKYVNMRVSWLRACPNWINTSVTIWSEGFDQKLRPEERFMKSAFQENFPNDPVPPILSQPCCSQFAVTKEAIRSNPRSQYKMQMDWLQNTRLESEVSGRVWEHMWQYLFTKKPIDCPAEHKALCKRYHICFEGQDDWDKWKTLEAKKFKIADHRNALLMNGIQPTSEVVTTLDEEIQEYDKKLQPWKEKAVERGRILQNRIDIAGDV
jgi:Protein of unknown function (DUF3431)